MKNYIMELQAFKEINIVVQAENEDDAWKQVTLLQEYGQLDLEAFGEIEILYTDASSATDEFVEKYYSKNNFDRAKETGNASYLRIQRFAEAMEGLTPEDLPRVFASLNPFINYSEYMDEQEFSFFDEMVRYDTRTNTFVKLP